MLRKLSGTRNPSGHADRIVAAAAPAPCEESRTRQEKSLGPKVLVVERDRLLRWALHEVLSDAGFQVLTVPEGRCAQAVIDDVGEEFSLALVDDDSWPLTAAARATLRQRSPALPIVVTTHSDDEAVERRVRRHGAAEVLVKPFDLPELVRRVRHLTTARVSGQPLPVDVAQAS
jgi:two-component system, response regulator FlrC